MLEIQFADLRHLAPLLRDGRTRPTISSMSVTYKNGKTWPLWNDQLPHWTLRAIQKGPVIEKRSYSSTNYLRRMVLDIPWIHPHPDGGWEETHDIFRLVTKIIDLGPYHGPKIPCIELCRRHGVIHA